ncbi:peptidyl-alpha-hydroxyglycine alpha-amidating lyase family protein [Phytohabitans flavus]|uniref:Peptidylamidoglycolate lyase n=1 Tax=Phytohabitans flavus TaxID=1076124 RepID=A0A6F8XLW7_9ACTN|nr:peptidyl-alpha-hydroxyglycine alpha-amidating lyase family protein [Phytohabitans flavus]BCB74812.1 hypothetical protein Pflav_012220 [Phytohabitans flavus]
MTGYAPATGWRGFLDTGVTFHGDANAVAVTSRDEVVVFNRGPVPVTVFDRSGALTAAWGTGEFARPHAVTVDRDDNLWLVDGRGGHTVQQRALDGELLLRLGGTPAEPHSGQPFNCPTDIAIHEPTGDVFVSDGYGNSSVHRFDRTGRHILSWGTPGGDPGQFYVPHNLAFLDEEHLIVCDRENFRLQIFTVDGAFVAQWHAFRPCAITVRAGLVYLAELGPAPAYHGLPDLGSRVRILTGDGRRVGTVGASRPGYGADEFVAPHSIALDSAGNLYVAEVARTWARDTLHIDWPGTEPVSLKKWELTT